MTTPPPDLEMVELRDAVTTAERAVEHWQARLRQTVGALQSLDGFVPWLLALLTGSRQQQMDDAIAGVELARGRLARARETLDEARALLAAAEQDRLDRTAAAHAETQRRERVAESLRRAAHPLTERFNGVEQRIDALEHDRTTLQQAYTTGMTLAAGLGGIQRKLEALAAPGRRSNEPPRIRVDDHEMKRLATQAMAFEDACSLIGLSVSVHLELPVRDQLGDLVRRFGHSVVVSLANQFESDRFVSSVQTAIDDTEGTLGPLLRHLRALQADLGVLHDEREDLLDRFERGER